MPEKGQQEVESQRGQRRPTGREKVRLVRFRWKNDEAGRKVRCGEVVALILCRTTIICEFFFFSPRNGRLEKRQARQAADRR